MDEVVLPRIVPIKEIRSAKSGQLYVECPDCKQYTRIRFVKKIGESKYLYDFTPSQCPWCKTKFSWQKS